MSTEHSSGASAEFKQASPAKPKRREKPEKPYPEFPLTAHPAGYWCKRIRGKLHYFGKWDDPDAALDQYRKQKDDLHAGRKPREDADGLTVKELCNRFLNAKAKARDAKEITQRSWQDYKDACDLIVQGFGKSRLVDDLSPDDFASLRSTMTKRWGLVTVGNTVQRCRVVFKYAFDSGLIDRPVRYGQSFKRPSKKTLRIHKAKQGEKLFTVDEVRALLAEAGTQLRAMILLGINCGFGNADVGTLPLKAVDFDRGIIDYPRPKTGIPRRCALWPETVEALKASLDMRPEPKSDEHASLVFITKYGLPWAKDIADSPVTKEFAKLLKKLGINGRKGLGFYTLRHTFRTVADESKDQPAVDHVMGHEVSHMSVVYRERIGDDRLRAVANHVRDWLYGAEEVQS